MKKPILLVVNHLRASRIEQIHQPIKRRGLQVRVSCAKIGEAMSRPTWLLSVKSAMTRSFASFK